MDFSTLLTLGGPVVYILIILSIYATAIIFYKLHIFYKVNFFNNVDLEKSIKLWVSKEHNQAYDEINKSNDPQTEVVSFTMYQLLKHKKLTSKLDSDLREEITRLMYRQVDGQRAPAADWPVVVVDRLGGRDEVSLREGRAFC